jgi:hypothetical protein
MIPSDEKRIAARDELAGLVEDRRKDPEQLELDHPAPSWVDTLNTDSADRKRIAARERRIRYLSNRLEKASRKMERDFDISSF